MTFTQRPDGAAVTIAITGELDLYCAEEVREKLKAIIEEGTRRIVLDLSQLTYLDSSGLGAFIVALQRIRAVGGAMEISGLCNAPKKVFELSNATRLFVIRSGTNGAQVS